MSDEVGFLVKYGIVKIDDGMITRTAKRGDFDIVLPKDINNIHVDS